MNDEFNYKSVPSGFAHCLQNKCSKAGKCLRNIAAQNVTTEYPYMTIVKPVCIPADGEQCPYFRPAEKIRVAWGVTRIFDNVPHKDATELKNRIIGHFGRSRYYRFYRKEYCITPEDQALIRKLFRQKGFQEEVSFDAYSEEYKW